jgi:hypothetical protein
MKLKGMPKMGRGKMGDKDVQTNAPHKGGEAFDAEEEQELGINTKSFREIAKDGGAAAPGSGEKQKPQAGSGEKAPETGPGGKAPEAASGEKAPESVSGGKPKEGEPEDLLELFREEAEQASDMFKPFASILQEVIVEDLAKECREMAELLKDKQASMNKQE